MRSSVQRQPVGAFATAAAVDGGASTKIEYAIARTTVAPSAFAVFLADAIGIAAVAEVEAKKTLRGMRDFSAGLALAY